MRRFLAVPIALTLPLVFVTASWLDTRLDPPCNVKERGLVLRTPDGSYTLEEGLPGNSQPPCRTKSEELKRKWDYVPQ